MNSNKYLLASLCCCLIMHIACQEIQFLPLPSISAPLIIEGEYSVTLTRIYPHAARPKQQHQPQKPKEQSSSQLTFDDRDEEIKAVPILAASVQTGNIHEYMAVTLIYPQLTDILIKAQYKPQEGSLDGLKIVQKMRNQPPLTSNDVNRAKPGVSSKPYIKQNKLSDYLTLFVIIVVIATVFVILYLKLKDSPQKKSTFNKLHRFGSASIDRDEDDEQESIVMSGRRNEVIIDASLMQD